MFLRCFCGLKPENLLAMLTRLLPLLALTAAAAQSPPCNLNGAPLPGGACACFPPWLGAQCGTLDVRPGAVAYGADASLWTWGGNVVLAADGTHHLFVAEMEGHCTLAVWSFNSACVHAVSTTGPLGPYARVGLAVPRFCHNPQVLALADGSFALFHIGDGASSQPQQNCSSPARAPPAQRSGSGSGAGSSLHLAATLGSPWLPSATPPPSCNNPAPMRHANGTLFLVCDSRALWRAPGIAGPWARVATWEPSGGPAGAYEDAFLWIDARGAWHMLFHVWSSDVQPQCTNATVSAHAFSEDGLTWHFSPSQPYNTTVAFASGRATEVSPTRERPKLLFAADGATPLFLLNGAVTGGESCLPKWCSHCKMLLKTYTLIVPLGDAGGRAAGLPGL